MLLSDSPLAPAYFVLAALVAASRVYVKMHHASDVLVPARQRSGVAIATRTQPPPAAAVRPGGIRERDHRSC
jgi:hypothetical protein